jgi:hypothetical protein
MGQRNDLGKIESVAYTRCEKTAIDMCGCLPPGLCLPVCRQVNNTSQTWGSEGWVGQNSTAWAKATVHSHQIISLHPLGWLRVFSCWDVSQQIMTNNKSLAVEACRLLVVDVTQNTMPTQSLR